MKKVNNYRPVQIPVGAYELLKEYCEMSGMKMGRRCGKVFTRMGKKMDYILNGMKMERKK